MKFLKNSLKIHNKLKTIILNKNFNQNCKIWEEILRKKKELW